MQVFIGDSISNGTLYVVKSNWMSQKYGREERLFIVFPSLLCLIVVLVVRCALMVLVLQMLLLMVVEFALLMVEVSLMDSWDQ